MLTALSLIALFVTLIGCIYTLLAARAVTRFSQREHASAIVYPAVSILKPLRGAEPGLYDALASFCAQDYPAPVQILFGTARAEDPCVPIVRKLIAAFPKCDLQLVVDPSTHGVNGKVSNLVNLAQRASHDLLIVSDSDIEVERDHLREVLDAFGDPEVGAATCLYRGSPRAGIWSQLAAMAIDYQFLPGVVVAVSLDIAHPCLGSTIALTRDTLEQIGGFGAFADHLADDYAIGAAVRKLRLKIAIARPLVLHLCSEGSDTALLRHELRWARTIRAIDPQGFAGSVVTHPLAFALLAAIFSGFALSGWIALSAAMACRFILQAAVDRALPGTAHSRWLMPARDLLSFAVFVASFFVAVVSWRGQRFRVHPDGTLSALNETSP
jgi:ceramide glucosyltransferase